MAAIAIRMLVLHAYSVQPTLVKVQFHISLFLGIGDRQKGKALGNLDRLWPVEFWVLLLAEIVDQIESQLILQF